MLSLRRLGSLRGETEMTGLVRTAEVALGVDHAAWLLLVEHLELSAGLLVPDTLHEGLRSSQWPSLLRLLSQSR